MKLPGLTKDSVAGAITIVVGLGAVAAIVGALAIFLGLVTVSARPPHSALARAVLHTTFKRAIAREAADIVVPPDLAAPGRAALGLQVYANECSSCHGGPGLGQSPVPLSMRPTPQHLADVVGQFSDAELYVILRDGVRFSAMPAWPAAKTDDAGIWSVVAFLRQLPTMDAATYLAAVAPPKTDTPAMPFGDPAPLKPMTWAAKAEPQNEYLYAAPGTGWHPIGSTNHPLDTCIGCHDADGSGSATGGYAPNLTVLSAAQIRTALTGYATGSRQNGVMSPIAASLSPSQIDALAQYFDSLPDVTPTPAADEALVAEGEKIALGGKPDAAVPACLTCHQQGDMQVPGIAGQNAAYIRSRLDTFARSGPEIGPRWYPMPFIAANLTDEERQAVAAYFARPAVTVASAATPPKADPARAADLVQKVCKTCHTETGAGSPSGEFPNISLQGPVYVAQQLHDFRARTRRASRMEQVADRLSEEDIAALARYFGDSPAQPSPAADPGLPNADLVAGQKIAQDGLPDRNVPSCLSCHGERSQVIGLFPHLQGQNPVYLKTRLDSFASAQPGELYGLNPMHAIAGPMTPQERRDVAAWFAAQPPVAKTQVTAH